MDRAGSGTSGVPGRVEQQDPMGTFGVIVPNKLGEYRPQVLLIDDDEVVEALVPQSADDALGHRIRSGRPHRAEQSLDA